MVRPPINSAKLRYLGLALKELRTNAGLRLIDVEKAAGVSTSALSRIENGQRLTNVNVNLTRLLLAYGASDADTERIMALAAEAVTQPANWVGTGSQVPQQLVVLRDYESAATRITGVSLAVVPGLLQTLDYMRAVLVAGGVPPPELAARLSFRMERQKVLDRDVEVVVMIDEPVLARPVGNLDVTIAQLRHIVTTSELSNVDIHVIPYGNANIQSRAGGSYQLLEFRDLPPVAHADHQLGGLFIDEELVQDLVRRTAQLRQSLPSTAESVALIRDVIDQLESR